MGFGDFLGKAIGGIGKLFGMGGGSSVNPITNMPGMGGAIQQIGFPSSGSVGQSLWGGASKAMGTGGGGGLGGLIGGIGKMFGGGAGGQTNNSFGNMLPGLATMFGSQLIGNPKPPALGGDYNQFMSMMRGGGTPGMQSANQYYQGVLSGQNKDMYEAATYSLDNTYEDEKKNLISMYKTLRPGTDPATDSTFNRDLAALEDRYARARAQTMAQVQQGAAQGAAGLGSQQMSGYATALQPQLEQLATQWGMNYQQKQALRDMLTGLGGKMISGPMDMQNLVQQMALLRGVK